MNERNVAASVRARLLNRARETKQDFSLVTRRFCCVAWLVGIAMFRAVHRWRMARVVDEALNELELMLVVRPMRHAGRQ